MKTFLDYKRKINELKKLKLNLKKKNYFKDIMHLISTGWVKFVQDSLNLNHYYQNEKKNSESSKNK